MFGLTGLAAFRFLDPRIRLPSEEASAAKYAQAVTSTAAKKPSTAIKSAVLPKNAPKMIKLDVPFIPEAPGGNWTGPWKNACEEASMLMVEKFYKGINKVTDADAKKEMTLLFQYQDKMWGSNANSDSARTVEIIRSQLSYDADISATPTVESIKAEIAAGHPVITPVNGKELGNPNIPFLASGTFYHMLVVIGYDDTTGEFITNDDGDNKEGAGRRYKYAPFLASVHDYVAKTRKTNGPMLAIITSPRTSVVK